MNTFSQYNFLIFLWRRCIIDVPRRGPFGVWKEEGKEGREGVRLCVMLGHKSKGIEALQRRRGERVKILCKLNYEVNK